MLKMGSALFGVTTALFTLATAARSQAPTKAATSHSRPAVAASGPAPLPSATACKDQSKLLPADQCNAWIAFYDGALGGQWSPTGCSRTNPCNCKAMFGPPNPVTCNDAGTSVTQMWVCSCAPTCAHARCRHSAAPTAPPPQFTARTACSSYIL